MQLQNKYLTFKQQLNSRSTESSLPYSEQQRGISCDILADNVPAPIQEPVAESRWTQLKSQWLCKQSLFKNSLFRRGPPQSPLEFATCCLLIGASAEEKGSKTSTSDHYTPVTLQATPAKVLPTSSILTPPPKVEAPS